MRIRSDTSQHKESRQLPSLSAASASSRAVCGRAARRRQRNTECRRTATYRRQRYAALTQVDRGNVARRNKSELPPGISARISSGQKKWLRSDAILSTACYIARLITTATRSTQRRPASGVRRNNAPAATREYGAGSARGAIRGADERVRLRSSRHARARLIAIDAARDGLADFGVNGAAIQQRTRPRDGR